MRRTFLTSGHAFELGEIDYDANRFPAVSSVRADLTARQTGETTTGVRAT